MQEYRNVFMNALDLGIRQYQQQNKATTVHNEEYIVPNVFDCIKKEDYKLFLHSFEDGVDISVCNADGYNPLTLAVYTGNNMMVQFLLDHGADASLKDKRGYNAFHTAVENQYRDICKMLLDVDPELIDTKTASGESVETLAKKQTFTKWIENEINNSF
jgi:ankyrin repeat protein